MLRIVVSRRFKKNLGNFIRKHPELRTVFATKLTILQTNPKDKRLRAHKLSGRFKDYFAVSLTPEYRLLFYIEKGSLFLLTIGTHDEVY